MILFVFSLFKEPIKYKDTTIYHLDAKGRLTIRILGPILMVIGGLTYYNDRTPPLLIPPVPEPTLYDWVSAEIGDCAFGDRPDDSRTFGSMEPKNARCTQRYEGTVAICWDGDKYPNILKEDNVTHYLWCTYMVTKLENCTGGGKNGYRYVCRKQ